MAGPFVGRDRELTRLQAALLDAAAGNVRRVFLVGEAGIGKSSIAQTFAARAVQQGARVLWGQCFEGDWHPPYGPWAEALGSYARDADPQRLRVELGSGAPLVARITPAVRDLLEAPEALVPLPADEERLRLFEAVAQFLLAACRDNPIVLVFDDLHWVDPDSIRLLRYIARSMAKARLLLVGIYRDPDPDLQPQTPFTDALGITLREVEWERIGLSGLALKEIGEYLARMTGTEPRDSIVQAVFAQCNGNPFYTTELVRHLLEEDILDGAEGDAPAEVDASTWGIPDSVRQVVRRRVGRLSARTIAMLRFAAGFTEEFSLPLLQAVTGFVEDDLLDSVDEALAAGIFRTTTRGPAGYDFAHAIFRHTIYEEISPDRRPRLHRDMAIALARLVESRAVGVGEVVAQYHASRSVPGAAAGLPFAIAAADEARARFAHEQAVAALRAARDLSLESGALEQAEVCCRLALAEAQALLLEDARRSAYAALAALERASTDPPTVAALLVPLIRALKEGGADYDTWEPLIDTGLGLLGEERNIWWARLTLLRDPCEVVSTGMLNATRWTGHDPNAVAISRAAGNEADYALTLEPLEWRSPDQTGEVRRLGRAWRDPANAIRAVNAAARDTLFCRGAFQEAIGLGKEMLAMASRIGSVVWQAEALALLATARIPVGELFLARQTVNRARELVDRLGPVHRLHAIFEGALPCVLSYHLEGDWQALADATERLVSYPAVGRRGTHGLVLGGCYALTHYRANSPSAAREMLALLTPALERVEPTAHQHNIAVHGAACAVWELGASDYAPRYRKLAEALRDAGVGDSPFGSNLLTIARMIALEGDLTTAAGYFEEARGTADEMGHRPTRAMADYDEATALLWARAPDPGRVADLLDAALAGFRGVGMEGWAQRAHELRTALGTGSTTRSGRATYPVGLTEREASVLNLLASGMSSKEIGQELVISLATVERHLTNIYRKIGARGRVEATAYAVRHGLAGHAPWS